MSGEMIEIAGELKHETDAAYLMNDGTKDVWLPKSKVDYDPRAGIFEMPEWLAIREGLV